MIIEVIFITFIAVAVLLLTAVPGYVMIKKKMLSEECISGFSKVLLFVCQPCLAVYTFKSAEYSPEKLADIGIFALLSVGIMLLMLSAAYLVLRKKCKDPVYRIMTIATSFANCAFFGIPVIEALMPEQAPGMIIYTTVFAVVMNVSGWTLGSAIIAQDPKYISPKKIFINPAMIGTAVALILFVTELPIQADLMSMITILGKMCSPLSMLIMGMRLATMKFLPMFTDLRIYLTVAVKQLVMPAVAFLAVAFLPLSLELRSAFFIICACPAASIVLNFAEIIGEGQREAANTVLLSTILSIVTMPIMMMLLPLMPL